MHNEIVIADTTCFILLSKIGELDLLKKLYGSVSTTEVVAAEYGETLPDWIIIKPVIDHQKQLILELQTDKGEASAIALALENTVRVIILDDLKGRSVAQKLGLNVTGTVGIIIKAKRIGLLPSIKPLLEKIRQTNFRLSAAIEVEALKQAGE